MTICLYEGYKGESSSLNAGIARLYNECMLVDHWWSRPVTSEEVESWFKGIDKYGFAYVGDSRLYGFAWAWRGLGVLRSALFIDPNLPRYEALETARALVSWARLWFERQGLWGLVSISTGAEHSHLESLVQELIGLGVEEYSGTMMILEAFNKVKPRLGVENLTIREASLRDVKGIVEVYNRAFSRYSWYTPISVEEYAEYFKTHRPRVLLAIVDGVVAGLIEFSIYRALDGKTTCYIAGLAVDPRFQGRGIGSTLILKALELVEGVVERVYLDAVKGLEGFYARYGFREYRRYKNIIVPLEELPDTIPCITRG